MRDTEAKQFHIYIMASRPRGTLYVGMTSNLAARAWEHRERVIEGFTKRYWIGRLVYYEPCECAAMAARKERSLKRWRRQWKIDLIEKDNPTWRDLFGDVLSAAGYDP